VSRRTYRSWLGPFLERFVALKRASGCGYKNQVLCLQAFDRHLVRVGHQAPLRNRDVWDYFAGMSYLSPRSRDNIVSVLWQALAYAAQHGARIEPLPERPTSPSKVRLREPFVLSHDEIERLLRAIQPSPYHPYCLPTRVTLLGLLYTPGARIAEALKLDVVDLDRREGLLSIRKGKFGKSRILPLPASTVAALTRYLQDERRPTRSAPDSPLFVSYLGRRLGYAGAWKGLRHAASRAGVRDARGRFPRPHDLRHTFAVRRVVAWYREGRDVNALLPGLSGYMGHVSVAHTQVYLHAAQLLLGEGARRFEASVEALFEEGAA